MPARAGYRGPGSESIVRAGKGTSTTFPGNIEGAYGEMLCYLLRNSFRSVRESSSVKDYHWCLLGTAADTFLRASGPVLAPGQLADQYSTHHDFRILTSRMYSIPVELVS